jgi:DNA (cytosine-5)-methyltransferase 1
VEALFAAEWTPEISSKARRVYLFMLEHGHDGPWMDHEHEIVVVLVHGIQLVIFDLGMRMLTPRELFRAQGFPDTYVIDPVGPRGKRLNKTEQIRAVGNSVCPQVAEAIVRSILARRPSSQNDDTRRARRAA